MAGKKDSEKSQVKIPTIMLNRPDGLGIINAIKHLESKGIESKVSVNIESVPIALDTSLMGNNDYPKIRSQTNIISVLSSSSWGAMLTSNGKEWQLFILPKDELITTFFNVWIAFSHLNQPISTTSAFTTNPVKMYKQSIKQVCPDNLQVVGSKVLFQ